MIFRTMPKIKDTLLGYKIVVSGKLLALEVLGVFGASRKTLHDFLSEMQPKIPKTSSMQIVYRTAMRN